MTSPELWSDEESTARLSAHTLACLIDGGM